MTSLFPIDDALHIGRIMTSPSRRLVTFLLLSMFMLSIPMLPLAHAAPTVYTIDWALSNPSFSPPTVPSGTAAVQSLSAGSWWILTGTYRSDIARTGGASGTIREDETYTQKLTVVSVNHQTIVITSSYNGTWRCTATGDWAESCGGAILTEMYSSQMDYTIDIASLRVTATSSDSTKDCPWHPTSTLPVTKDCVGHPTSILLDTKIGLRDTALKYWYAPKSDATGDTITDVIWKVDSLQKIGVDGVDVTVRVVTYGGQHLGGYYQRGTGAYSNGLRTDSELYDTVYGINMGWIIDGTYTDSSGSWTETTQNTAQITETNLDLQFRLPQVTITISRPPANAFVTVDSASYASNELPKVFTWDPNSIHTLQVDAIIQGDQGVRYVFVEWSGGSEEASRSITASQSRNLTVTFKTQYELKVISDLGDPQGGGWYDAGRTATFSVRSPQPAKGLLGYLGGGATFQTWTGDSTQSTTTADIMMDGPKTVQAEWTTDYSVPYMVLGGIGVAIVVVTTLALLLMRCKKTPAPCLLPHRHQLVLNRLSA